MKPDRIAALRMFWGSSKIVKECLDEIERQSQQIEQDKDVITALQQSIDCKNEYIADTERELWRFTKK